MYHVPFYLHPVHLLSPILSHVAVALAHVYSYVNQGLRILGDSMCYGVLIVFMYKTEQRLCLVTN